MSRINIFNVTGPGISYLDAQNDTGTGVDGNIKRAEWYEWSVTLADATTVVNRGSLYKFIEAHEALISAEAAAQGLAPLEEGCCRFFCSGTSNEDLLKYLKIVETHLSPIDAFAPSKSWARLQGEADFGDNNYAYAAVHLKKVKDLDVQYERGVSFINAGQQTKGTNILNKALAQYLKQDSWIACTEAVKYYNALGKKTDADYMQVKAAVMKAKQDINASGGPSLAGGKTAFEQNKWAEAIAHLEGFKDTDSLYRVGRSYYELNQPRIACGFLEEASRNGHVESFTLQGHCYSMLGHYQEAFSVYKKGWEKGSQSALLWCIELLRKASSYEINEDPALLAQLELARVKLASTD